MQNEKDALHEKELNGTFIQHQLSKIRIFIVSYKEKSSQRLSAQNPSKN